MRITGTGRHLLIIGDSDHGPDFFYLCYRAVGDQEIDCDGYIVRETDWILPEPLLFTIEKRETILDMLKFDAQRDD